MRSALGMKAVTRGGIRAAAQSTEAGNNIDVITVSDRVAGGGKREARTMQTKAGAVQARCIGDEGAEISARGVGQDITQGDGREELTTNEHADRIRRRWRARESWWRRREVAARLSIMSGFVF